MPIYSYQCQNKNCEEIYEKITKVQERDNVKTCPECLEELKRIIDLPSPPQFNGTGFTPKFYPNKE